MNPNAVTITVSKTVVNLQINDLQVFFIFGKNTLPPPSMRDKERNAEVSSSTKIKNIKPIFNRAVNEELISKDPFERVKLKFESEELAFFSEY